MDPTAPAALPRSGVPYRRPAGGEQELQFEFTRDPAVLGQYHAIYEREFRLVHNPRYRHEEDEHDRRGYVLAVLRDGECVGGARLSVKTAEHPDLLPIEMGTFRLEHHFPHLEGSSYGQLGRLCLLPELRDGSITRLVFWHMYRKAWTLGLTEMFGTASLVGARTYKQHCRPLGLDVHIHHQITLPEYPMCEGIRFFLLQTPLREPPIAPAASRPARVTEGA